MSRGLFRQAWDTECPHMRICPPCCNTCDMYYECKMLVTKGKKCTSDNALTKLNDKADEINLETNLLRSAAHIAIARAQHTHINECIRLAKQDNADNSHFYHLWCVTTFNFA